MKRRFAAALQHSWYGARPWRGLLPLAAVYGGVVRLRRMAYRRGWLASEHPGVPVLVVGNITVGGSGKTPLVLELIRRLEARGRRVGVVARGYGGRAARYPLIVDAGTAAAEAGDEPVLLARRSGAAVAVDPVRTRAARYVVAQAGVDLLIADDGLQHYALARTAEITVTDARRGLGNGRLLPAGPLREGLGRLAEVDLALTHGPGRDFWLAPDAVRRLDGSAHCPLSAFIGQRVHALAGIGDPERFFDMLRASGLDVMEHPMPDHHAYTATDLDFGDSRPLLMTEKDAVKCERFAAVHHWVVPVGLRFSVSAEARVDALLTRLCAAGPANNGRGQQ